MVWMRLRKEVLQGNGPVFSLPGARLNHKPLRLSAHLLCLSFDGLEIEFFSFGTDFRMFLSVDRHIGDMLHFQVGAFFR